MSKMLGIENCYQCYHHSLMSECKIKREIKTEIYNIPPGCPLPDKPEPITEKFLDDIQFDKIGKDLIVALINAHFLGRK